MTSRAAMTPSLQLRRHSNALRPSVVMVLLASVAVPHQAVQRWSPEALPLAREPSNLVLRSGDIILRRGVTWASSAVMVFDTAARYSHAGIIAFLRDSTYVIHVEPRNATGAGHVIVEPIADFIHPTKASAFVVYRLRQNLSANVSTAVEAALSYAAVPIAFDGRFDADDSSQLYCTELIWLAFKHGGLDLVPNFRDRARPPWGGASIILLSDIQASTLLEPATE